MTCVCDLLSRLAENQPNVTNTKDYQGVVLLDEIDLHLHPKWANTIVNKLTTWFPNIQFFFTTHSPIVLLGASRDAVFYKLYKEDGVIKISQPLESISSLTANTILTSPLFGLEDAISDAFDVDKDDPNTEDHYWDSIIHKEISKRISKNAGVTELDIIKLVNEELDKLEEEAKRDKN
jgi:predicted ATP-binding protein involved in virulence